MKNQHNVIYDKPLINVVVAGHLNAGKSTLTRYLLSEIGHDVTKSPRRNDADDTTEYATNMANNVDVKLRCSLTTGHSRIDTKRRFVNLIDTDGNKSLIEDTIRCTAQADYAFLVVDATHGEFESDFDRVGGQTEEHTLIIRSLGITQLAVVVNKLDNCEWSEDRYFAIRWKLRALFKRSGFSENNVQYVPCNALTGVNVISKPDARSELSAWYDGKCLVDAIDSFKLVERHVEKSFRMCINDVISDEKKSDVITSGRIIAGGIKVAQYVIVLPVGEICVVNSITVDGENVNAAFAGDHVSIALSINADESIVTVGSVLCDVSDPPSVTSTAEARIVVFLVADVTIGQSCVIHYAGLAEQASIKLLVSRLNKYTGNVMETEPLCLPINSCGAVVLSFHRPCCVETFNRNKRLGRFVMRANGKTIAAGMFISVL